MNPAEWSAGQKQEYALGGSRGEAGQSLNTDRFAFAREVLANRVPPPALVGDVGCNDGSFCRELALKGYGVVGLDFEEAFQGRAFEPYETYMSTHATVEATPPGDGHVLYVGGDIDLKDAGYYWEKPFDALVLLEVLEHVVYDYSLLLWAKNALRKGGVLILSVPKTDGNCLPGDHHLRFFTQASLLKMLWVVGFVDIDIKPGDASLLCQAVKP